MGMFTTIRDPAKNLEVQIKCGWDACDVFSVGDTVPWQIIEDWPQQGYLLDDVYLGNGGDPQDWDTWEAYWVVIENHVVQTAFVLQEGDYYPELRERYGIQDPPEDLWSDKVWEKHRAEMAEAEKQHTEFVASVAHLSPIERTAQTLHRAFGRRIDYSIIGREFFQIQPLPVKDVLLFDKYPDTSDDEEG